MEQINRVVVVAVMRRGAVTELKVFGNSHAAGIYYHQKLEEENQRAESSEEPWKHGPDSTVQLFHTEVI